MPSPQVEADRHTLIDSLRRATREGGRFVFHLDDDPVDLPHAEVAERAEVGARSLRALGVGKGDIVGVLGPNHPDWVVAAWSAWRAGAAVTPIGFPMRLRDRRSFAEQLRNLIEGAGIRLVLASPAFLELLPSGRGVDWTFRETPAGVVAPELPHRDDPAVIQFTSGSTGSPKGVLLTHGTITTHLNLSANETLRSLAWVPFFHDWGLVSHVQRPVHTSNVTHHLPTERFARDPAEWLRLVEPTGAERTGGPPSGWASALRAAERAPAGIDLRGLKRCGIGAESIDPQLLERLLEVGARLGMQPTAPQASYGLAEAVLGVTSTKVGQRLRIDRVGLDALLSDGRAEPTDRDPSKRVVSCGWPGRGFTLRIVDPVHLEDLAERRVGEIWVKGPAMMHTYIGQEAPNPFVDGWLRTGDLGYLADGELFVTGRIKDMIIVGGRNYYPDDFEWAANRVEGVRPGRCVAFSRAERELVLLVEPAEDADAAALPARVRNFVADAVGVRPAEVLVVPAGTVQKTTSGKLQRAAMRDAYLRGSLPG